MNKLQFVFIVLSLFISICTSGKTVVIDNKMSTKSINDKLVTFQGGDTLLLKKGYYRVNLKLINKIGVQDNPIVIRGEDRMHTIIDGGAPEPNSN